MSWGRLGPSWAVLGASWDVLEGSCEHLGGILGHLGGILEASWDILGILEASWRHLGGILEASCGILGPKRKKAMTTPKRSRTKMGEGGGGLVGSGEYEGQEPLRSCDICDLCEML